MKEKKAKHNERIVIDNFGPIIKADIELKDVTVFIGESGVGKSYLAKLIFGLYNLIDNLVDNIYTNTYVYSKGNANPIIDLENLKFYFGVSFLNQIASNFDLNTLYYYNTKIEICNQEECIETFAQGNISNLKLFRHKILKHDTQN